ncbi:rhodanese-like domain-containing protein [Pseudodesulfovibrio indicus]|jgi:rhodanese-related sulfurtransferase|uniref:Sulfurtransferase n=1 Tax=Pseudodesulfovibrio indicus TaxID=1716143 RepID=A0A140D9E3_9BACT|nr:rhodanese-like domain-containing protein [Pseudodesulfovibrio indicus]AMK09810.1 sulfurtransferase [Pseudodesulfovibrio indicus]TDT80554.1 3-mercaptopyruvate sulfurtransferase SseA [Pseudodesulfovibrio indicus]
MHKKLIAVAVVLAFMVAAMAGPAAAQDGKKPAFKQYTAIVDYAFVAKYAKMPQPKDVMVIDSRPYKPKYVEGYIPTAVSIPASQFDKMTDKLPANKGALLIFYCGGFDCPLSHKSAYAAEALGYTNIKVYAAGFPDWKKNAPYYSIGLENLSERIAAGDQQLVIDARPYKKFLEGAIPSAVGIPEKDFAAKRGMLPVDKANVTLIYYCGGYACALSHKSAVKARYLGYKNVLVAEAGYPGWKEMFGAADTGAVMAGEAEGAVDTEWFLATIKSNPDSILLIDVRDPEEYAAGHFPSAVNMTVDMIEKQAAEIPTDKPIVFSCASGARAGEAFYLFKDLRPEVEKVFYLEATNSFGSDNSYEVHPNK